MGLVVTVKTEIRKVSEGYEVMHGKRACGRIALLSGSEYPSAESSWQKSEGIDPALSYSWKMNPDNSRDSSSKTSSVLLPVCQS